LVDRLAVDPEEALPDGHPIAGEAHHPLHEEVPGVEGVAEDDHLAPAGRPEEVGDPLHHQPLPAVEGGQHGRTLHGEGPSDEGHDEEGQDKGADGCPPGLRQPRWPAVGGGQPGRRWTWVLRVGQGGSRLLSGPHSSQSRRSSTCRQTGAYRRNRASSRWARLSPISASRAMASKASSTWSRRVCSIRLAMLRRWARCRGRAGFGSTTDWYQDGTAPAKANRA